ncbi:MAG: hypothetical protein RL187_934 [Actinomycetota bacterium]|jgi:hypothetical protein
MAKSQPYEVKETIPGGVEIRHYPSHTLISVNVRAGFDNAGNIGFRPLVSYISGANQSRTQIAMTTPVTQAPHPDDVHTISFVLPEGMTPDDAPLPVDGHVRVVEKADSRVAALRFRGVWQERAARAQAEKLLLAVARSGYRAVGEVFFARYDPPITPGFLRRNEALVEVA